MKLTPCSSYLEIRRKEAASAKELKVGGGDASMGASGSHASQAPANALGAAGSSRPTKYASNWGMNAF